jgi:hypothetical protein
MMAYMAAVFGGVGAGWLWSEIKILKDPDLTWAAGLFSVAGAGAAAAVPGTVLTEAEIMAKAGRIFLGIIFLFCFWAVKLFKAD